MAELFDWEYTHYLKSHTTYGGWGSEQILNTIHFLGL